jgi:hypothetical protein
MSARLWVPLLVALAAARAGDKKLPLGTASNDVVQLDARAFNDKAGIQQVLGSELAEGFVVLQMTVTPRGGKPLAVSLDDFMIRSDKDGQKSGAFSPSQIAGNGVLIVSTTGRGGGGMMGESGGPAWGGIGGMPSRLPGQGGGFGNAGVETGAQSTVSSGARDKENPLLGVLREKILPEKETSEPVSGQLYFFLDGKHKLKQLELLYRGAGGKLSIRFAN